jgi:hypothetical protein
MIPPTATFPPIPSSIPEDTYRTLLSTTSAIISYSNSKIPSTSSPSILYNILPSTDLQRKPTLFPTLHRYSVNVINTSSHSPFPSRSWKSYSLVDDSVTSAGSFCCTRSMSWTCGRYIWGNLMWWNWNDVWRKGRTIRTSERTMRKS